MKKWSPIQVLSGSLTLK